MLHTSHLSKGNSVAFPEWRGERHYMLPFSQEKGLPKIAERYSKAVEQMMTGVQVDSTQECYLMVDEQEVKPNAFHRRPGVHVDGYWNPGIQAHRGTGHGGTPAHHPMPIQPYRHGPQPTHLAYPPPWKLDPSGHHVNESHKEGLILASNHAACQAYVGNYERDFIAEWKGGDCSELDISQLQPVFLEAGIAYYGDVFTLHESLPVTEAVKRTLIRINVPGIQ